MVIIVEKKRLRKGYVGIRARLFLCMFLLTMSMTILVDIGVYNIYKKDIEYKSLSFLEEIIMKHSEVMRASVQSLEENMMYKIANSGIFDYQKNLTSVPVFTIEQRIQNFAAMMNTRNLNIDSVYVQDIHGVSFCYDKEGSFQETLNNFKMTEVSQYIDENYEYLMSRPGVTLWRRFVDKSENIFLIKSSLNQESLVFEGIVCVGIDKGFMKAMADSLSSNLAIYDETGSLLFCHDSIKEVIPAYLEVSQNNGSEYVAEFFQSKDGGSPLRGLAYGYLMTWTSLYKKRWTLIGFVSEEIVLASIWALMKILFILQGGFLILSIILAARISKNMTYNISMLIDNFRKINLGKEVESVRYHSNDETAYLCMQFNDMNAKLKESIEQMVINRTQREKAEYYALLAQMNPHFLYNVLESINSMAKLRNQEEISIVIDRLGKLLRVSIAGNESDMPSEIPLDQELEYVEKYLSLQRLVTGDRINWDIVVDETLKCCKVPKLILQPIVENSIIHGVDDMQDSAMIVVIVKEKDGKLQIEVCDNGKGMDQKMADQLLKKEELDKPKTRRTHIGIKNIQRRISILYGEGYGLQIVSAIGNGTVVKLYLPFNR
jgi:sensor histidine kinase YesM